MTTNYEKGRRKEYKVVNQLKADGFDIVFRSAGSHSPIDVVAISRTENIIKLIQCKPKSMSDKARDALENKHSWLNYQFSVRFEVI